MFVGRIIDKGYRIVDPKEKVESKYRMIEQDENPSDFYISKENSNIKSQWWRWPLMPFASFIGASIGAVLFTALQWFGMKLYGGYSEDGWFYIYVLPIISSAVFGWIYVWITYNIAPTGKLIAGAVMTTVLGFIGVASLVIVWGVDKYSTSEAIQSTVGAVATLFTAIVTLVQLHQDR